MCCVIYKRYFPETKIEDCECLTDENIGEYEKWLENRVVNLDGNYLDNATALPGSLSTAALRDDTATPNLETFPEHTTALPNTLHWAKLVYTQTTLFSAYYDDRPNLSSLPSILVIGYQAKTHKRVSVYCLFKYKDGSTEVSSRRSIILEIDRCDQEKEFDKKNERQFLHIFHMCQLERGNEIPSHVALSHRRSCNVTTKFIPVSHNRPPSKMKFGVCVQTPAFQKSLHEFVTFIEMQILLGAQHITLYCTLDIEPSVVSNLKEMYPSYFLDIIDWPNMFHEKEPIHYYGEILAIHDCLYRNMYAFDYLVFVDLDEVLIPKRHEDWKTMLQEIDRPYIDSFIFVNTVYMQSVSPSNTAVESQTTTLSNCDQNIVPQYFTHFDRSVCEFPHFQRSKLIIKPELILDLNIHSVCTRLYDTTHYLVPTSSASSHHYRRIPTIECRKNRRTRKYETVYDDWMLKYASSLYSATNKLLCRSSELN